MTIPTIPVRLAALLMLGAFAAPLRAQYPDPSASAANGDTAWAMAATILIGIAIIGVACRHAAMTSNPTIAATPHAAQAALVALLWSAIGYSLVFAPGSEVIGGLGQTLLANLAAAAPGTRIPESAFALLQMSAAMLAAALIAGIWIGRARLGWALLFVSGWLLLVYAPIAHWLSGAGWLASMGALDYAGGAAVHLAVGSSALVLARVIGPAPLPLRPLPGPAAAGAALTWIGLIALIGGSALGADDSAASAMLNAVLAASAGAFGWLLSGQLRSGRRAPRGIFGGGIAGLAAIAPSALFVSPGAAMLIGAIAGVICLRTARALARRIDDPLDIVATHGMGGALGLLLTAGFAFPALGGLGFEDDTRFIALFAAQGIAVLVVALWAGLLSWLIAKAAALIWPIRAEA